MLQNIERTITGNKQTWLDRVRVASSEHAIVIYGAGMYGRKMAALLQSEGIQISGYAVTDKKYNQESIQGLPVGNVYDILEREPETVFLIGVKSAWQKEIETLLRKAGAHFLPAPRYLSEILDDYFARPVMEITPKAGCSVHCRYCPQDIFLKQYFSQDRQAEMTLDEFKRYLGKMPQDLVVDFSGFVEPFLAKDGLRMVQYAHENGHEVRLFTTLVGLDMASFRAIEDIPFKLVVLHLPDVHHYANIPVTEEYLELLRYVVSKKRPNGEPFVDTANCQSEPDPRVVEIIGHRFLISWDLIDRAENLEGQNLRKTKLDKVKNEAGYYCNRALHLNHNVLLPNGDVVLCCMDFGMRHILGNLQKQSYEEIMNGGEMQRIKKELQGKANILCGGCTSLRKL